MGDIVNLKKLHKKLKLTDEQKEILGDVFGVLGAFLYRDELHSIGTTEGLNTAFKVVMGIDDDYNFFHMKHKQRQIDSIKERHPAAVDFLKI